MNPTMHLKLSPQGLDQMLWHRASWTALGSQVSVQVLASSKDAKNIFRDAQGWLEDFEKQVSRFRPHSQVSRWNRGEIDRLDGLALQTFQASCWAAETSGGLLDPMIAGQMQEAGYAASRTGKEAEKSWQEIWNQPIHPAIPRELKAWQAKEPQDGYQYDPGGAGKGLAADLMLDYLKGRSRAILIDLGGDLRFQADQELPAFPVLLADPRTNQEWIELGEYSGAWATSSFCRRLWIGEDGRVRHHLLSPQDGQPVWNHLAGVAAFSDTALEAETRAKWALLLGSDEPLLDGGFLYPANPSLEPIRVEPVR